MAIKYRRVNLPMPIYNNFKAKQERMERVLREQFGSHKRISLTKVMLAASQKEIYLSDDELKKLTKRRIFKI